MTSRRTERAAQAILETVSTTVLFELRDPRIKHVTVTNVEVTGDLRLAKVYVSVLGDDRTQNLTMHGLNSARGYIQAKVADRLATRYTPVLTFVLDQGLKRSAEASRILRSVIDGEATLETTAIGEAPGEVSDGTTGEVPRVGEPGDAPRSPADRTDDPDSTELESADQG